MKILVQHEHVVIANQPRIKSTRGQNHTNFGRCLQRLRRNLDSYDIPWDVRMKARGSRNGSACFDEAGDTIHVVPFPRSFIEDISNPLNGPTAGHGRLQYPLKGQPNREPRREWKRSRSSEDVRSDVLQR